MSSTTILRRDFHAVTRPSLILASTSPYRRQLLQRLAMPFSVVDPEVDETPQPGEEPEPLVRRLSMAKARCVSRQYPGCVVIGSDQVAVIRGVITGKPGRHDVAVEQLRQASGEKVVFFTGVSCYKTEETGECSSSAVVPFRVQFRRLSDEVIDRYLRRDVPYNCAGSFKSEGLGVALFERMIGEDPTALMGLPLMTLTAMLEEMGLPVI